MVETVLVTGLWLEVCDRTAIVYQNELELLESSFAARPGATPIGFSETRYLFSIGHGFTLLAHHRTREELTLDLLYAPEVNLSVSKVVPRRLVAVSKRLYLACDSIYDTIGVSDF
ncbi:hypothetical protein [Halovivax ruber]|uniref:hypothetical protein n=1 Tax=Halovivax ruber TaxID=387341 RepID=UPI001C0A8FEC|nr:hypothetical protein [Halovivax ruber]